VAQKGICKNEMSKYKSCGRESEEGEWLVLLTVFSSEFLIEKPQSILCP